MPILLNPRLRLRRHLLGLLEATASFLPLKFGWLGEAMATAPATPMGAGRGDSLWASFELLRLRATDRTTAFLAMREVPRHSDKYLSPSRNSPPPPPTKNKNIEWRSCPLRWLADVMAENFHKDADGPARRAKGHRVRELTHSLSLFPLMGRGIGDAIAEAPPLLRGASEPFRMHAEQEMVSVATERWGSWAGYFWDWGGRPPKVGDMARACDASACAIEPRNRRSPRPFKSWS